MSFLGLGKKKKAASGTEAERRVKLKNDREQLVLDALKDLKASGDSRFFDLVARQAGLPAQSHNDLDEFFDRYERFQKLSRLADKGDGIGRQIGEVANAIEPMVQRLMGGMPSAPTQIQVPVGYRLVPIEAPSQIPAQASAEAPAASPQEAVSEAVPMSAVSIQVINILSGMTPQQGAEWLIAQNAKFAKWLVGTICITPDAQLSLLLAEVTLKEVPDFAGVVAWMQARPDWFAAFVSAVRTIKQKWPATVGSTA